MPSPPITGDQRLIKAINRNVLLRLLLDEPGLSRAGLAELSGLTKSTVSLLAKALLDEGWLTEDSAAVTGSMGRRPTPLRINGRGLALIGAELATDCLRIVRTSPHGEILESAQVPLDDRLPDVACRQLAALVIAQSRQVARAGARLLGIGVGLPGAVDTMHGVLQSAPSNGWRHVEVGRHLARELAAARLGRVPVYCRNEADLAAVGETSFGSSPVDEPLVYVSCSVGVGAGIVLNGTLVTGATGRAGEIGHATLHLDGLLCACGRRGCAQAYVGLKAVARAAGRLRGDEIDRAGLGADLASRRSRRTRQAFAVAGNALGVVLHNLWTTFDPMAIVVGGEAVTLGGAHFLEPAVARLARFGADAGLPPPPVRVARHADLASAIGGAAFALNALVRPG
jgi:predicted NBD/HSP70 family sugar kinase